MFGHECDISDTMTLRRVEKFIKEHIEELTKQLELGNPDKEFISGYRRGLLAVRMKIQEDKKYELKTS